MDHNLPGKRSADVTSRWGVVKTWKQRICSYLYKYKQMIEKPKHESCPNFNTNIIPNSFQICKGSFLPSCGDIWIPSPLEENKEEIIKNDIKKRRWTKYILTVMTMQRFLVQYWSFAKRWNTASRIYIIMGSWE